MYAKCLNKDVLFSEVINSQGYQVLFCDVLTGICLQEWNHILTILSNFFFTHDFDKLSWRWEATGKYSVKSLYHFLNYKGILVEQPLLWWPLPIPSKI